MELKNALQKIINVNFKEHFGYTPLNERLKDIQNEFFELMKWTDVKNLKEEAGDLLASVIQLHNENGWDIEETIYDTLSKIESRKEQYKSLGRKTKVAILGGAFNPITKGHIQTAQFILNTSGEFDEVWLMPANKHMTKGEFIVSAEDRLAMCMKAVKFDARIKVFPYEIDHNLAGETYYLAKRLKEDKKLSEKYNFSIAIGLDNAETFDKWVNYEELERLMRFVIIPRKGYSPKDFNAWYLKPPHIFLNTETDIMDVSSTIVRDILSGKKEDDSEKIGDYVDLSVLAYINKNNLYK